MIQACKAVDPSFWKGKRVLLTGHTGFKGSWMSLWLKEMGAELTGYSLTPPTSPSLFEDAKIADGMHSVIGDIRDLSSLMKIFSETKPEIVIHMAAQPLVRESYNFPVETYEINVMGTVNVLEAVRQTSGVRSVLIVTTDKCYENKEWEWGYREDEPIGGYDPYSNSKGCAELVTSAYRRSYFDPDKYNTHHVAVASARAGNVIGGGDWADDRLIPDIIRSVMKGEPVSIRSPYATRPWQHVLESISAYLLLAERLYIDGSDCAQAWNIGPCAQDVRNVEGIVSTVCEIWGNGASYLVDSHPQPHEANYLKLDISKIQSRLGWHPTWSLTVTLEKTITWYKAYSKGGNALDLCRSQIGQYILDSNSKYSKESEKQ
jgi:CDP-glucose 4,6-dehydratase